MTPSTNAALLPPPLPTGFWHATPGVLLRGALPLGVALVLALLLQFLLVPNIGGYPVIIINLIGINIILAVSLNIVNGYTGQFSIGHAAFMGLGAYTAATITTYTSMAVWGSSRPVGGFLGVGDWLFVGALLAGGLVAAAAGWVVGLPSLRLRGDYLAIVTLGFNEVFRVLIQNSYGVLSASELAEAPAWRVPVSLGGALGFTGAPAYTNTFWIYVFVGVVVLASYRLKRSIHGLAFLSIRENEVAAEAMGVPTTKFKVYAFVLAALFAGIGGGLYAHLIGMAVNPREFGFQRSFDIMIYVVLGGLGSISGATLAAIALTILQEYLRDYAQYRLIIYAVLLVLVMIFRPQGLFGIHEIWDLPKLAWWKRLFGTGDTRRGGTP